MKYVVFKDRYVYHPVLFADHTSHSQIKLEGCLPVSAGFVQMDKGAIRCYGKSDSLRLCSDPKRDENLIRSLTLNFGMYAFFE